MNAVIYSRVSSNLQTVDRQDYSLQEFANKFKGTSQVYYYYTEHSRGKFRILVDFNYSKCLNMSNLIEIV